ncbi:MAG: hypothetical protein ACKOPO_09790, partial [Novosphingobium sp.]
MKLRRILIIAFIGIVGVLIYRNIGPGAAPAKPAADAACKTTTFEDKAFTACVAVPGKHRIAMRITGSDKVIYRGFPLLAKDVDSKTVAFAINGGMYDTGSRPIGYYVENGERLHQLNKANA